MLLITQANFPHPALLLSPFLLLHSQLRSRNALGGQKFPKCLLFEPEAGTKGAMRVSMLFSKRLVTLVIPSSFFPITASDPPHLSLLSVQRVDLVRGGGRRGCPKGNQYRTKSD